MKKTNSIIEEALIEASQLEEAVKEVGKEVLASAMKQEIDEIIKSSLTEEEEVESPEMDSMGMETPEMPETPEVPEMPEMDDDMESDEEGGEEVMDMTNASDAEVIKVFKAMGPEDSIEVTKTEDGVHLKDGDKEYILQMEGVEEMTDEELDEYLDEATFEDFDDLEIELDDEDEDDDEEEYEEDEDIMYELEMDEDSMEGYMSAENPENSDMAEEMDEDEEFEGWMREMMDEDSEEEDEEVMYEIELSEEENESIMDEDMDEEEDDEDELEEAARTYGNGSRDGSRGLRKGITPNRYISYKNGVDIKVESLNKKLSLVESELKGYKAKNEEYKKALSTLKEKMNEMAVYYTNLSYTNKLFTEHTTTKKEKLDILKRFDNVRNINESKSLFGIITDELSSKKSISNLGDLSESVDKSLTSSSSKLTESVVYEDPKIKQIKELMSKLSPSRK